MENKRLNLSLKLSHRQAEEPAAWTAVMLDHMRAMDFTKHHERHPAGRPHGLSFYRPIGTSPQLTKTENHLLSTSTRHHNNTHAAEKL